jgi:hypothetical protein
MDTRSATNAAASPTCALRTPAMRFPFVSVQSSVRGQAERSKGGPALRPLYLALEQASRLLLDSDAVTGGTRSNRAIGRMVVNRASNVVPLGEDADGVDLPLPREHCCRVALGEVAESRTRR